MDYESLVGMEYNYLVSMKRNTQWYDVLRAAKLTSTGFVAAVNERDYNVSDKWKRGILCAEHSPIRELTFTWVWSGLPYYSSVHFVRHHVGITHYVKSQRKKRDNEEMPLQDAPVSHMCTANAQAILNISRDRLCMTADKVTRVAWEEVVNWLRCSGEEILAEFCVPKCVKMRHCPEFEKSSCGKMPRLL